MDQPKAIFKSVTVKPTNIGRPARSPRKRGRWIRRGIMILIVSCLSVWFSPAILAYTFLRHRIPKSLMPNSICTIEYDEVNLGWLQAIVLKNVRIVDSASHPLLDIQSFSTSETMWGLVTHLGNCGTIKFVKPVVYATFRNNSSNIEDVCGSILKSGSSKKSRVNAVIEIENAKIQFEHQVANWQSTIEQIALRVNVEDGACNEFDLVMGNPDAVNPPISANGSNTQEWMIVHYGDSPGSKTTSGAQAKKLSMRAAQWKIDRLRTCLSRMVPTIDVKGELNADVSMILSQSTTSLDWDWHGTFSVKNLHVAGIEAIKHDELNLDRVELSGRAVASNGRIAMQDVKLLTDVGEVSATGDLPLTYDPQKSPLELARSLLSNEDYHLSAQLDLKKLAAKVPRTLHIREGIEITSGDVKLEFVGVEVDGARRWSGAAGIVGLNATTNGRAIPWDKPLLARFNAHRDHDKITVDRVECKSDFLQLAGSGTLDSAQFTASGNLSNLIDRLDQFLDLGVSQLAGQLVAKGELRRIEGGQVGLTSKVQLDNFAYVVSKKQAWKEPHLEVAFTAIAQIDPMVGVQRIAKGEVHFRSGTDAFDLALKQPIDLTTASRNSEVNIALKGNVATWQSRLTPFISSSAWFASGVIDLSTTIASDTTSLDVTQLSIGLQNLELDGSGWIIQEPNLKCDGTIRWNTKTRKLEFPKTSVNGSSISLQLENLECIAGERGLSIVSGSATYRADLKQISHWRNIALEKPGYYLIGNLSGTVSVSEINGIASANLDAQAEKFMIVGQGKSKDGQPIWVVLLKERLVKLSAKGGYDPMADKLALDSSTAEIDGMSIYANGALTGCTSVPLVSLTGELAYDWDRLVKRLGDQIGGSVQLTGKDRRPFSLSGSMASFTNSDQASSHSSAKSMTSNDTKASSTPVSQRQIAAASMMSDLTGRFGASWSSANIYGITAGPADFSLQLNNAVGQFAPIDVAVNEGRLHLTPAIHFEQNPNMIILPQETLLDHIRLSPELCQSWLKYALPTLADSAQVEGNFSMSVQGAALPLSAPMTGRLDGIVSIHRAQVVPGSLGLRIVESIERVQSIITRRQPGDPNRQRVWVEMPEQQIPVKLVEGRVYHQGMTFVVKNVTVQTRGSVGVDETLNLVAEIAIRDEWVGNSAALGRLKGQSIQIPINGTLSHPELDPQVFANLLRQIGGSAIEGILQDKVGGGLDNAVNKGLDKLFNRKN